jgi:hypothetical protein
VPVKLCLTFELREPLAVDKGEEVVIHLRLLGFPMTPWIVAAWLSPHHNDS